VSDFRQKANNAVNTAPWVAVNKRSCLRFQSTRAVDFPCPFVRRVSTFFDADCSQTHAHLVATVPLQHALVLGHSCAYQCTHVCPTRLCRMQAAQPNSKRWIMITLQPLPVWQRRLASSASALSPLLEPTPTSLPQTLCSSMACFMLRLMAWCVIWTLGSVPILYGAAFAYW